MLDDRPSVRTTQNAALRLHKSSVQCHQRVPFCFEQPWRVAGQSL